MLVTFIFAVNIAEAQTNHRFGIDIPFDFIIAGKKLTAGKYTFERFDPAKPNLLKIKSADKCTVRVFITSRLESVNPSSGTSRVVFKQRGGAYYLFQVWTADEVIGSQLTPGTGGNADERGNKATFVRLTANAGKP
jgi:hypothetical protein